MRKNKTKLNKNRFIIYIQNEVRKIHYKPVPIAVNYIIIHVVVVGRPR